MPKICNDCLNSIYCWEENWEKGTSYCYRDQEDLSVNKEKNKEIEVSGGD